MKKLLLSLSLFSILNATELPIEDIERINTYHNIEPSGIVKYQNHLIIVSDNGRVCDLDTGECKRLKKYDLEGITSSGSELYVAVEGKDDIYRLDNRFEKIERYKIPRKFMNEKILPKGGDGIEGLAFMYEKNGERYFAVTNQSKRLYGYDSSKIIYLKVNSNGKAVILDTYNPGVKDLSGLFYQNGILYVLSDKENKILLIKGKQILKEYENVPGEDQEGIFIEGNVLYIAQDSGGVLKITLSKKL